MGTITLDTSAGPITFQISGEQPTVSERLKINRVLSQQVPQRQREQRKREAGFDPQFDVETGIQDLGLRRALSLADDAEEEEAALAMKGLKPEDYIRDNRGRLALTPSGAAKFGVETDKNVLIDESGFSRADLADLAGMVPEVGGAIAGAIGGQAVIPIPILGAVIGAAVGGGGGNLLEEGIEAAMGISRQSAAEIARDTAIEAGIAAAGEGIVGLIGKSFGVVGRGLGPQRLTQDQAKTIKESLEMGVAPAPGLVGAPALIARAVATEEQIFKGSARTRANNEAIQTALDNLRARAGTSDPDALGRTIIAAVQQGDETLGRAVDNAGVAILRGMESTADDLGRAATKDLRLDEDLYGAFRAAYENFDNIAQAKWTRINRAMESPIGDSRFIPTADIAKKAKDMRKNYRPTQTGTTGGAVETMLERIGLLGKKSSFSELYNARKSLNDLLRNNARSQTIQREGRVFLDALDRRLELLTDPKAIASFAANSGRNIDGAALRQISDAASDLRGAREFYEKGMRYFDEVGSAASIRAIREELKNGVVPNVEETVFKLVKPNKPRYLIAAKTLFDEFGGRGSFETFRQRMASQWLRNSLEKSVNSARPDKFSASAFNKDVKALGTTLDQLFGQQANAVRKLANEIDSVSLRNVDQSVIDRVIASGADENAVGLLRNLKEAQKEASEFARDRAINAFRREGLSPQEAADLIVNGSTKPTTITKIMKYYDNSPEAMQQLRGTYMEHIIGDFGESFLVEPKQLKAFGTRLIKEYDSGKLGAVFGEEMADEMAKFGRVLNFNARTVEGGGLVAANIAASPVQNLGKLLRYTIIGRVFSSPLFYKNLSKRVNAMTGEGVSRPEAVGRIISQALSSAVAQTSAQSIEEGVSETTRQGRAYLDSMAARQQRPASQTITRTNISVPEIPPVQTPAVSDVSNIRQRARENPAVAATLLGGLGSAGLL
jgi:hypothetical protein